MPKTFENTNLKTDNSAVVELPQPGNTEGKALHFLTFDTEIGSRIYRGEHSKGEIIACFSLGAAIIWDDDDEPLTYLWERDREFLEGITINSGEPIVKIGLKDLGERGRHLVELEAELEQKRREIAGQWEERVRTRDAIALIGGNRELLSELVEAQLGVSLSSMESEIKTLRGNYRTLQAENQELKKQILPEANGVKAADETREIENSAPLTLESPPAETSGAHLKEKTGASDVLVLEPPQVEAAQILEPPATDPPGFETKGEFAQVYEAWEEKTSSPPAEKKLSKVEEFLESLTRGIRGITWATIRDVVNQSAKGLEKLEAGAKTKPQKQLIAELPRIAAEWMRANHKRDFKWLPERWELAIKEELGTSLFYKGDWVLYDHNDSGTPSLFEVAEDEHQGWVRVRRGKKAAISALAKHVVKTEPPQQERAS